MIAISTLLAATAIATVASAAESLDTVLVPAAGGRYSSWRPEWSVAPESAGSLWVQFQAKARNDIHVGLLDKSKLPAEWTAGSFSVEGWSGVKMYEIVIGGWGNGASTIRYSPQGQSFTHKNGDSPCSEAEFRDFWVSYSKSSGRIAYGTGPIVGQNLVMVDVVSGDENLYDVAAFAFSSWDVDIEYRNIYFGQEELDFGGLYMIGSPIDIDDDLADGADVVVDPSWGTYTTWSADWMSETGSLWLKFSARTSNDIHVAFADSSINGGEVPDSVQSGSQEPLYEFVLGGWGNYHSVIRFNSQAPEAKGADNSPCTSEEFSDYWIAYDKAAQTVAFGLGRELYQNELLFLELTDDSKVYDVKYFGFSSWDAVVAYRNIEFGDSFDFGDDEVIVDDGWFNQPADEGLKNGPTFVQQMAKIIKSFFTKTPM